DGEQKRDHPEPTGFPKNLKRRVLIAPLPPDDAETLALMQSARAKGFGEIWLRVESDGEEARARLQSAIATGKTLALPVGTVLPWVLKKPNSGNAKMVEDVNIFGETGAKAWAGRRDDLSELKKDPVTREFGMMYQRKREAQSVDWVTPDAALAARRLRPFLALPGLRGAVLTSTVPPGYDGAQQVVNLGTEAIMGYTPALRLACVRATGIDPVDVAGQGNALGVTPRLPFLSDTYSVIAPMANFRLAQNKAFMANLWTELRLTSTTIPVYLDERIADGETRHPFYARWSDPKRVPTLPENTYEESAMRTAAFQASAEPLLASRETPGGLSPGYFWDGWYKKTHAAASNWRGFVVDLSYQSPEQIAGFLKQLPDNAVPDASTKPNSAVKKKGRKLL
ncbi:MAG: hypothetical protein H7Y38_04145, partial [Armatimonadetes bacterium]|nr:hypothetical protein [Armatimonadota bacterium]